MIYGYIKHEIEKKKKNKTAAILGKNEVYVE